MEDIRIETGLNPDTAQARSSKLDGLLLMHEMYRTILIIPDWRWAQVDGHGPRHALLRLVAEALYGDMSLLHLISDGAFCRGGADCWKATTDLGLLVWDNDRDDGAKPMITAYRNAADWLGLSRNAILRAAGAKGVDQWRKTDLARDISRD